jgi:hypothetical protein
VAALLISILLGGASRADQIRIAYFQTELGRGGPGLLLRDLIRGNDPQVEAVIDVIELAAPDVIVLGGIDYDDGLLALGALRDRLADRGLELNHVHSEEPNSGAALPNSPLFQGSIETQSFGHFRGSRGMAILSALPFSAPPVSLTDMIWADLPWVDPPLESRRRAVQRLSAHNHWLTEIALPNGDELSLLTLHASAPVFDGPEDRNGHRNADEIRLWAKVLDGWRPNEMPLGDISNPVVVGTLNADPNDGESRTGAVGTLLQNAELQDPGPSSAGAARQSSLDGGVNLSHRTDPALDTVDWPDDRADSPGNLRVDYILPSRKLKVVGSGVLWPDNDQPELLETVRKASRHRLVWVDLSLP